MARISQAQWADVYSGLLATSLRELGSEEDDEDLSAVIPTVEEYLLKRIRPRFPFIVNSRTIKPLHSDTETISVGQLRERLAHAGVVPRTPLTVEGTFSPGVLLAPGWWEGRTSSITSDWAALLPLQQWLLRGFEDWGPSWDLSPLWTDPGACFLGQIAGVDEVDSLPVLVPPNKVKKFRKLLIDVEAKHGSRVFNARVTGYLCHWSQISPEYPGQRDRSSGSIWDTIDDRSFEYCIVLREGDPKHQIERLAGARTLYSAYMWRCLAPRKKLKNLESRQSLRLNDVYFVWEHADLTSHDAMKYAREMLSRKAEYIQEYHRKVLEDDVLDIYLESPLDDSANPHHLLDFRPRVPLPVHWGVQLDRVVWDEGPRLEFKAAVLRALGTMSRKDLEFAIAKSLAGFMNSGGGTLLIGVEDNGKVIGVQHELEEFERRRRDGHAVGKGQDGYQNLVISILQQWLGRNLFRYLDFSFPVRNGYTLFRIDIRPAAEPVFLNGDFFVRVDRSSRGCTPEQTLAYIQQQWGGSFTS